MAISTTFSNFFSILSPTKLPPHQFPLSPSLIRFPSQHNHNLRRDKLVPLVASRDNDSPPDLSSVVTPSLTNEATTRPILFRKAIHAQVLVEDGESEEAPLIRFRREVMKSGILQELKRRRFHESKRDKRRRKAREAAKRRSRARNPGRPRPGRKSPGQSKQDVPKIEKEEDDDNWELPDEDMLNFLYY